LNNFSAKISPYSAFLRQGSFVELFFGVDRPLLRISAAGKVTLNYFLAKSIPNPHFCGREFTLNYFSAKISPYSVGFRQGSFVESFFRGKRTSYIKPVGSPRVVLSLPARNFNPPYRDNIPSPGRGLRESVVESATSGHQLPPALDYQASLSTCGPSTKPSARQSVDHACRGWTPADKEPGDFVINIDTQRDTAVNFVADLFCFVV